MKQFLNGKIIDIEVEETEVIDPIPYEQRVVNRIHEVYSIDDEISMLWKDPSDPEVIQYRSFVEQIKAEERNKE